jgi:uncharacterized protein (TIGR01319 family)
MKVVCIDIGSTWTKGALFAMTASSRGSIFNAVKRESTPTSIHDLAIGYGKVVDGLTEGSKTPVLCSSSAKGGLKVFAVGLVPELTLEAARISALSAGARVDRVYSYKLTRADIKEIETLEPDIILLSGGTDGGNSSYLLHNTKSLAASESRATIIFAGNRSVRDEVEDILKGKPCRFTENILPELDTINPEPARAAIRDLFLETIVQGKGLSTIEEKTGSPPLPTPYCIFEYVKLLHQLASGWEQFCLFDIGGATTDLYSACTDSPETERCIQRGIPEPRIKRSVEGDLGMRISAASLVPRETEQNRDLLSWVDRVSASPGLLAEKEEEKAMDRYLATECIQRALSRHVGHLKKIYTSTGPAFIRRGKDLRQVNRIIGTGGYLSRMEGFLPLNALNTLVSENPEESLLLPGQADYYRDRDYLMPLLANLARVYPEEAVRTGTASLYKECTEFREQV